ACQDQDAQGDEREQYGRTCPEVGAQANLAVLELGVSHSDIIVGTRDRGRAAGRGAHLAPDRPRAGHVMSVLGMSSPPTEPRRRRTSVSRRIEGAAIVVAIGLLAWGVVDAVTGPSTVPSTAPRRSEGRKPNLVVILTDDQRWDSLAVMPNVQRLLAGHGVTFE